jgi:hypothetical protein
MLSGDLVLFFSRLLKLAEKAAVKFDAYQIAGEHLCGEYPFRMRIKRWYGRAPTPKRSKLAAPTAKKLSKSEWMVSDPCLLLGREETLQI